MAGDLKSKLTRVLFHQFNLLIMRSFALKRRASVLVLVVLSSPPQTVVVSLGPLQASSNQGWPQEALTWQDEEEGQPTEDEGHNKRRRALIQFPGTEQEQYCAKRACVIALRADLI